MMFISALTGHFKDFILINILIIFHEIGHITIALFFNYKIDRVVIYPFGGITIFNDLVNRPIYQELLIVLAGPIYQIILYTLCMKIYPSNLLTSYHYTLLIFNLLPIYPLDGSKILNLIISIFISFNLSHVLSIMISIITLILSISFVLKLNYNTFLMVILLLLSLDIYKEIKNHKSLFNKFLLERYLYQIRFKKMKVVHNLKEMKRDYYHVFLKDNKLIKEKEILSNLFDF